MEQVTPETPEIPEYEQDDLEIAYYTIGRALSIKQPKWLQAELTVVHRYLEDSISWERLH